MRNNLLAKDRKRINNILAKNDFTSGRNRSKSVCGVISVLTELLSDNGISLDMITGDQLLASTGTLRASFRPTHTEPFEEHPQFENSIVSFSWHTDPRDGLVDLSKAEVVAYLS
jgi:hypothetical protein